jgi:hypothetical protein
MTFAPNNGNLKRLDELDGLAPQSAAGQHSKLEIRLKSS